MKHPLILDKFIDKTSNRVLHCSALQGEKPYWCETNSKKYIENYSPINHQHLTKISPCHTLLLNQLITFSVESYHQWRSHPAPIRGKLIKQIAVLVKDYQDDLAHYITLETGKTQQESLGEVQEWIDMCDFAVGLSRQLHGITMSSERPMHHMRETWHPVGPIAVISAFNFPIAVWAWNAMLAFVCGNSVVWKPSEQTPLCSLACARIIQLAIESCNFEIPDGLLTLVFGRKNVGQALAEHNDIALVSATGSVAMGRDVSCRVAKRLGRSLLELSGNNALILSKHADTELALRAVLFSAIGTSGQRCTSLRRLIIQQDIAQHFIPTLVNAYQSITIGDPRDPGIHLGPLINRKAFDNMQIAIERATRQGGQLLCGGERLMVSVPQGGYYVQPAIMEVDEHAEILQEETFAPLLFIVRYHDFNQAIAINNNSRLGLSSALFSNNVQECEYFLSSLGSDCGICNVNIGTSGAEIGGAFGGEKETGGGRESGSDAWKNYMRRATNTINYGHQLPLAQGIKF
jgi:aldehyde dehydrogenase (NAD+)